jgi:hypothetical protein
MVSLMLGLASAVVITLLVAMVSRRGAHARSGSRASEAADGNGGWMPMMSADGGGADCGGSDGGGCDGGGGGSD